MATLRARRTLSTTRTPSSHPPASAVMPTGKLHVLDVPFAMRGVAAACGARWHAARSVFVWRGDALPPALVPFQPAAYSWEAHVQGELDAPRIRTVSVPNAAITLRPHQNEAVRAI